MKDTKKLELKEMEKINGGIDLLDAIKHLTTKSQMADMGSASEPQQKHTIGFPI